MSTKDVHMSRKVSNVRMHVECVIGRTKKFKIVNSIIPIKIVDLLDSVTVVICALVNLNNSVVSEPFPAVIYLVKVNNRNIRARCAICSKLMIEIAERRH